MRSPAAILSLVALAVTPSATSAQTWVTVNVTALAPAPPSDLAAVRSEYASALNAGDAGRLGAVGREYFTHDRVQEVFNRALQ